MRSEIIQAADAEDRQFFVSLGKTLEKGLAPNLHPKDTDQYQLFLVKQWVHFDSAHKLLHDPKRSLCYYGNKIIAEICHRVFPEMEEKKVNTLTALRLRLGLKLAPGKMSHVKQFSEAPPDTEIIFADWFTQANNSA